MENDFIHIDPGIMVGKPVIKGTRITVDLIKREFEAGMSVEEILDAHPRLTREGIAAAKEYAAKGHYLGPCANPTLTRKRR